MNILNELKRFLTQYISHTPQGNKEEYAVAVLDINDDFNFDNLDHFTNFVYLILSDKRITSIHQGFDVAYLLTNEENALSQNINNIFKNIFNAKLPHEISGKDNRNEFRDLKLGQAIDKYFEIEEKYTWQKR